MYMWLNKGNESSYHDCVKDCSQELRHKLNRFTPHMIGQDPRPIPSFCLNRWQKFWSSLPTWLAMNRMNINVMAADISRWYHIRQWFLIGKEWLNVYKFFSSFLTPWIFASFKITVAAPLWSRINQFWCDAISIAIHQVKRWTQLALFLIWCSCTCTCMGALVLNLCIRNCWQTLHIAFLLLKWLQILNHSSALVQTQKCVPFSQ